MNPQFRQAKQGKTGDFININPIIEEAFSDFKVGKSRVPIAFLSYAGKSDTYLTYYTWYEEPETFYDDEYHAEISYGTIDIFSKGNFKNILKKAKQKLKENGFVWTDNGSEEFEKETGYYHIPVNFYYAGSAENS